MEAHGDYGHPHPRHPHGRMMEKMMDELLPCPFCGGSVRCQSTVTDVAVWCIACGAKVVRLHYIGSTVDWDSTPHAVAAWNRRTPTDGEGG